MPTLADLPLLVAGLGDADAPTGLGDMDLPAVDISLMPVPPDLLLTPPVPFEVTVHRLPGFTEIARTAVTEAEYHSELNDPGTGSITLPADIVGAEGYVDVYDDDYDAIDLQVNDVVSLYDDGRLTAAFIVEEIAEHTLDTAGGGQRTTGASGHGPGIVASWGLIEPWLGAGVLPKEIDHAIDWSHPGFPRTGFRSATEISSVADAADPGSLPPWPSQPMAVDFPIAEATGAQVIWASSGVLDEAPVGRCLLLSPAGAEIPAAGRHGLWIFVDNRAQSVRWNGQNIGSVDIRDGFEKATFIMLPDVTAGPFTLGVDAENLGPNSVVAGPGGVAAALFKIDQQNQIVGGPILVTDSNWSILEYPSAIPGYTIGGAALMELARITARDDCLSWLEPDFTADLDSDGRPWPLVVDLSTKTANSYLTFLRELSGTYVDFEIDRNSRRFSMWAKDGQGSVVDHEVTPVTRESPWTGDLIGLDRVRR